MSGLYRALHVAEGAAADLALKARVVTTLVEETPGWLKKVIADADKAGEELRFVIEKMEREAV